MPEHDRDVAVLEALHDELAKARSLADARGKVLDEAVRLMAILCELAAGPNLSPMGVLHVAKLVDDNRPSPIDNARLLELLGGPQ